MGRSLIGLSFAMAFLVPGPVLADEADDLVKLSRNSFLEEYETRYVDSMMIQKELLMRISPEFEANFNVGPVTNEESAAFGCLYDTLAETGSLPVLAKQMLAFDVVREKMEADPEFDMVNMIFDEEFSEEFANEIPDEAFSAMSDCGLISLSSSRLDFNSDLWAKLGQEASARGFTD